MKVAVIGSRGQLGSALVSEFKGRGWDIIKTTFDVVVPIRALPPVDVIINCAAYHRFDECEQYPLLAFDTNAVGALNVAKAAEKQGALNVYISTDYTADPCNVYAISKRAGEEMTRAYSGQYLIVRFGSLFGGKPRKKGLSFVDQVLKKAEHGEPIEAVQDVISPAYTKDVAKLLYQIMHRRHYVSGEVLNLSNQGKCSYYEFALEIVKQAGYQTKVYPVAIYDPRRPRDVSAENPLGFRTWQEALAEYLEGKK